MPGVFPTPEPVLETARLILRPPRREDFDGYAEMLGDDEATRYIGGSSPRGAAWRRFLQMPGAWMVQGFGMFSVIDKGTREWLGQAGPWQPEGWPGTEVGWTFRRSAWGRGYAREAATAAIDWAFDHLGWQEVIHCIDPGNQRSRALAEHLGSRILRSAQLPAPYDEDVVDVWGQSRGEWLARRAAPGAPATSK
ncbi:MAG TPA: GNAT family N-acetyltransferase [Rhodanobacteraceae bacterium]|nr:GNAT family N-acetyltransferase [Rhodanobacteraceae bacterium]